jgi:hypothetical protein
VTPVGFLGFESFFALGRHFWDRLVLRWRLRPQTTVCNWPLEFVVYQKDLEFSNVLARPKTRNALRPEHQRVTPATIIKDAYMGAMIVFQRSWLRDLNPERTSLLATIYMQQSKERSWDTHGRGTVVPGKTKH